MTIPTLKMDLFSDDDPESPTRPEVPVAMDGVMGDSFDQGQNGRLPSYIEAQHEFFNHANLNVPGPQELDFDFENVVIHNENEANARNETKAKKKTSRQRRSMFRRARKKKPSASQGGIGANSMDSSEDYAYDNHIALEGVENTHPTIVVSQVRDAFHDGVGDVTLDADDNFPPSASIDVFDAEADALQEEEEDEVFTLEGTVSKKKKKRRGNHRKFSIASALTDISFRSERSNSSKVSNPSLLDVDWEADEDLRDTLNEFMQNRGGKKRNRRNKRGSQSTRSSDSEMEETSDLLDSMYSSKQSAEDRIFENIKMQKELIESVRTQPWAMKKKLKALQLAKAYVERYEGQLSRGQGYQEASAKYWKRVKREFFNFLSTLIPWEMRIKLIESYFGSVVASYFTFLRWMFWVNIVMTVLSMCFIVIPEILFGSPWGSIPQKSVPPADRTRALNFDTIFNFGGYLEHSWLFYGYYAPTKIIGGVYRLPLAYLLVGLCQYGTSFLIILRKMTANSRMNKLTTKDEEYTFTWKSFTSWDFMIGNAETAKNKVAEITTVIRETIEEEKERTKKETTKTLIFLRVLANFLVLIVLAASMYAINLTVVRSQAVEVRLQKGENVGWWDQNEVSIVMSLITALFPTIFDVIGLMEKYHPRLNLRLQLGRILVLYLMNLYTLMFALYWKIVDKAEAGAKRQASIANCTLEATTAPPGVLVTELPKFNSTNCTTGENKRVCWETMLGQEISKLVFFDLIMTVATIIFIDFVRGLGVRYLNRYWFWDLEQQFPEYGEFKLAENLLHAIYNQATVWLGVFFAPCLPAVNIIKMIIMLYVRSWAVVVCNIPHERVFRASRSNNFYFATLLLMLFLVTLPVAFLLVNLTPSNDCGPFNGFDKSYHVLTKTIENELPVWVNSVIDYIASPGTIMPLLLFLVMAIYYILSLNSSLKESNTDLRNQLHVERTEEREKAYKLGGEASGKSAAAEDGGGDGASPAGDNKTKPKPDSSAAAATVETDKDKADNADEVVEDGEKEAINSLPKRARVLRIPGMSLDQANLLKSKIPGLKVMNRDEAVRLNIIPPPPPPPPEPETDEEGELEIDAEPKPEVRVDVEPASLADVDTTPTDTDNTPINTSRESDYHPLEQIKNKANKPKEQLATESQQPHSISPSLPIRPKTGPGSSPPIAVVHGKPMKNNPFRFGDIQPDSPADDAALF